MMFATKALSWQPLLRVRLARPELAKISELAQRTLRQTRRAAEPVVRQGITLIGQAGHKVVQALDKFAKPAGQCFSVAMVATDKRPSLAALELKPLGFLGICRLALRLLVVAVAERGQATGGPTASLKPKSPWLISQKDDLIYLIGSSAVSYAFMALLFIFKVKPKTVFWLYVLFFDGPHIFGTFSRTYADPEEWHKRGKLLLASLLWFAPGPVLVRLGLGQYFDVFAYMWAYYHLVKQHYGFSVLYKKKNNDLAKLDNYLDKALIWTGFTLPYVQFLFGPNYPAGYLSLSKFLPKWTPKLSAAAFGLTLSAYVARQVYKLSQNQPINTPKQLLLASSIGMHMVTFQLPFARLGNGPSSLMSIVAVLTVYHNTQYNRLIWFHNQNKYVKGAQKGEQFGLASLLSKNGWRFALCAFLFGASYRIPLGNLSQGRWGVSEEAGRYITAFGWGFAFTHYYLDSKIWRVRHDARLDKALQTGNNAK